MGLPGESEAEELHSIDFSVMIDIQLHEIHNYN